MNLKDVYVSGMNDKRKINNKYKTFSNFIYDNYPDSKKILDVGVGNASTSIFLSRLGYEVTAIDKFNPVVLDRIKKNNIKYIDSYFTLDTNIDDYDLISGLHCCAGVELIIKKAIEEDKEFVVTVCEARGNMDKREDYINYLLSLDDRFKCDTLPIYIAGNCWGETIYYKKNKR